METDRGIFHLHVYKAFFGVFNPFGVGRGGGRVYSFSSIALVVSKTIDPRIPTMPGRSTSDFHRPGKILLAPRQA